MLGNKEKNICFVPRGYDQPVNATLRGFDTIHFLLNAPLLL